MNSPLNSPSSPISASSAAPVALKPVAASVRDGGRDWNAFATPRPDGSTHMDLAVEGITCAACMSTIEHGLKALPGVTAARLNLTTHRLAVDWTPAAVDAGQVVRRLEELGYRAHPFDPGRRSAEEEAETRELMRCMGAAGFATMNIMLLSVSVWAGNATDIDGPTRDLFHWVSALIAVPAVFYSGRPFFRSALRALRAYRTNMDVPISIGITLTLGLSIFETMRHAPEAYFDSVVMLLFFLLTGRFLDQNMRRRTRSVAENVAALRAETASRILPDGTVREVPLSKIDPGALVLVRPGERVAVDGVVEDGGSEIDQSLVTGETTHVPVAKGARVYAGTLNVSGALRVRVTAATEGTLLDEVNRLLEAAAQAKSRYMRLADRAARAYAPVVHSAALLTFLGWTVVKGLPVADALVVAVSVLIITCPCALALAIPAVQVVVSGLLFKRGVLLHSGDAIERLAAVDTVVFDKTGTLTVGHPAVTDIVGLGTDGVEMLRLAASVQAASEHPLARAFLAAAELRRLPLARAEGFRSFTGRGVGATVDGRRVVIGNEAFMAEEGVDLRLLAREKTRLEGAAKTVVAVARDGEALGLVALADPVRAEAAEAVAALKARDIETRMLTGDAEPVARSVATKLGLDGFEGPVRPEQKSARVEAYRRGGRIVAMVGDGVNDAPALAAADVGIAIGTGADVALETAGVTLMRPDPRLVPASIEIARATWAKIRQNLFWAFAYNVIGVPLAALGYLTPALAGAAMALSSVSVVTNALTLTRWRPKGER